ncbi:hypothetical protein [Xylella fastidiosa]|uniref:hypothetical protein n=1 Tax=Xylella fastidiosa TaxID=2371 RepID=UPI001F261915|nr:hypothetical protein [Xylella fastidiosa]
MADFDISPTLHWMPASKTQRTIAPLSSKQASKQAHHPAHHSQENPENEGPASTDASMNFAHLLKSTPLTLTPTDPMTEHPSDTQQGGLGR